MITIEFTKPCKTKYQRFNYHFGVDDNKSKKFEKGDRIPKIEKIFDQQEEGFSVFSMKVDKICDEIAFENYFNVPKDSYKIIK